MSSQPGDYIGGGQTYAYSAADGTFVAQANGDQGVSISFHTPQYEHWWYLDFSAADAAALTPGSYIGAVRFPFEGAGQPGLSVYGDGRGCNTLTGSFQVKRIAFGADGAVDSFWAVFEQHCEGQLPALTGDVRINADVEVALTAPFSLRVVRGRALTFDVTATETHGDPLRLTGADLPSGATFTDHGDGTGTFAWTPPTSTPLGPIGVRFQADNGRGTTDTATTTIDVRGVTRLTMSSQSGDWVGAGRSYQFGVDDGTFEPASNYAAGFSLAFFSPGYVEDWFLDFAAPDKVSLVTGSYPNATRYPFEPPGVAGLDVAGDGRGCNTLTGSFDVRQLIRKGDGSIASFWATFVQHCEGGQPTLSGDLRYDADLLPANNPPVARAGGNRTAECTSYDGAQVQLVGSDSYDADGDALTFSWSAPGIQFDNPHAARPIATFPLGSTTVTLSVSDGRLVGSDSIVVRVVDTTPPAVTLIATPRVLWPADHTLRTVSFDLRVHDACDPAPTIVLTSASSSEPDSGLGDGDLSPDIVGADFGVADTSMQLRAEQRTGGPGRVYTLVYTARDASANSVERPVHVTVSHDRRRALPTLPTPVQKPAARSAR